MMKAGNKADKLPVKETRDGNVCQRTSLNTRGIWNSILYSVQATTWLIRMIKADHVDAFLTCCQAILSHIGHARPLHKTGFLVVSHCLPLFSQSGHSAIDEDRENDDGGNNYHVSFPPPGYCQEHGVFGKAGGRRIKPGGSGFPF